MSALQHYTPSDEAIAQLRVLMQNVPAPDMQPLDAFSYGYRHVSPAETAKRRLRHIIRADREAAQDGRWVWLKRHSLRIDGATVWCRPVFRWEQRK